MNPETRLAIAHRAEIAHGRVLSIGLTMPDAVVFHTDLRAHLEAPGSTFGPWFSAGEPLDSVVVALQPAAERTRMLVAMAVSSARAGATLTLVGHNDAGARSAGKFLEPYGTPAVLDARYHCRAWQVIITDPTPSALTDWRSTHTFEGMAIVSYPGVFAHGHVDDATRLLLAHLEPRARALDVGCGSGVIAAWLGARGSSVDAVDVDALALQSTQETAPAASVFASDVFSAVEGRYELIVSNPPFHAGKRQTSEASIRLIHEARAHLEPGGELWLVANRFLPYPRALEESFGSFDVVAEDRSYRVYRAR